MARVHASSRDWPWTLSAPNSPPGSIRPHRLSSVSQLSSTLIGHTTSAGGGDGFAGDRSTAARNATVCIVLPSPMSSASTPPLLLAQSAYRNRTPSRWYSLRWQFSAAGTYRTSSSGVPGGAEGVPSPLSPRLSGFPAPSVSSHSLDGGPRTRSPASSADWTERNWPGPPATGAKASTSPTGTCAIRREGEKEGRERRPGSAEAREDFRRKVGTPEGSRRVRGGRAGMRGFSPRIGP